MSKSQMRAQCAQLCDAYLLKGGFIQYHAADHRSRPRQKIGARGHRVIPMWQRLAIASMR